MASQLNISGSKLSRQLIVVVVDCTAVMWPHFKLLRETCLEPILRHHVERCRAQNLAVDYAVVAFKDYPPFADFVVASTGVMKRDYFAHTLATLSFSGGGYQAGAVHEGLLSAYSICKNFDETAEKYIILLTNSPPHTTCCRSVSTAINCFDLARLFANDKMAFSIIAPRRIMHLEGLFKEAKIDNVMEFVSCDKKLPNSINLLIMLRGLSIPSTSAFPTTALPTADVAIKHSPVKTPLPEKPLWTGYVTWQTHQTDITQLAAFAAPGVDRSKYASHEWPGTMVIRGVCSCEDAAIKQKLPNAVSMEFRPISQGGATGFAAQYTLYQTLSQRSWAAVVNLQTKTLIIMAVSQKLLGYLLPKMTLTPKPGAGSNLKR